MFNKKTLLSLLSALAIYIVCAVYITYPLIFNIGKLATGFGDELLISWIMNWVIHALTTNPLQLFNTNIFYPYTNTLAYSDLHLISAIISSPAVWITGQPISAINFTFILSLILLPFGIFALSFYISKNFWTALISGLLVAFSPAVLDKKIHVQILAIEWITFAILSFLVYVETKKYKYFVLSCFFFLIQTLNSFMAGYFLVFFYSIYFIYGWFTNKKNILLLINKKNILTVLATLLILVPFIIPYFKVSQEFNYKRDIRESIHFALQPEDLIYPSDDTRLSQFLKSLSNSANYPANAEIKPGYLGFVFSALSLMTIIYWFKNRKKKGMNIFTVFLISGILGLFLSFGPFLHLGRMTIHNPFPIPLPYLPFYYLLPGFSGFRNSARFEMMFIVFISIPIAIMLSQILKHQTIKMKTFTVLLLIGLTMFEFNFPLKFFNVAQSKDFPKIFSYLKTIPTDSKIIIMPIFNWNMWGAQIEIQREYYSTVAFAKMVNGASGFSPPPWQKMVEKLHDSFPDSNSVNTLQQMGVNYILIDSATYDKGYSENTEKYDSKTVLARLSKNKNLKFVKEVDNYSVFRLK